MMAVLAAITHPVAITSSNLFIAGLAIIGIMLVMRWTRRRAVKSRSKATVPARQRYAHLAHDNSAVRSLENVMSEMDELSRQIHGRLDTKIARLEVIIRDADERIARLSRLQQRSPESSPYPQEVSPSLDITLDSEAPLEFEGPKTADDLHDASHSRGDDLAGAAPLDEAHARVHALADRGLTPEQIASEVSRPVGEVELILSLRETGAGSTAR